MIIRVSSFLSSPLLPPALIYSFDFLQYSILSCPHKPLPSPQDNVIHVSPYLCTYPHLHQGLRGEQRMGHGGDGDLGRRFLQELLLQRGSGFS